MAKGFRVVVVGALFSLLTVALSAQTWDPGSPNSGAATFEMRGTPQDWVTGGKQYRIGPNDGTWSGAVIYDSQADNPVPLGVRIAFDDTDATPEQLGDWWDLEFHVATIPGAVFGVGKYTDGQRAPFADEGHPGIEVTGDGRGCNTIKGEFEITAFEYDCFPGSTENAFHLTRLAATFKQYCEGGTSYLVGSISYTAPSTGTSCAGGSGDGGDGGDTPTPPPPPPPFQVTLPAELAVSPLAIANAAKKTIDFGTAVDTTFNGDLQLFAVTNASPTDDFHATITPSTIAAPGAGEGHIEITTGPMTFPKTYTVTVLATDDGVRYQGTSFSVDVQCTPPFIIGTDQPVTAGAAGAANVDLQTKVSGSGPFQYQWYRGFRGMTRNPVATTGPKLTVPNDGSSYWVRVQNACGSVDSQTVAASR